MKRFFLNRPGSFLWKSVLILAAFIIGWVLIAQFNPKSMPEVLAVYASPIHASCYQPQPDRCHIHVEPFTINISTGTSLSEFKLVAIRTGSGIQTMIYDFRPDQSNPIPYSGSTFTPSSVAKDFAATCGQTYQINLQGKDSGDVGMYSLGTTDQFTCPAVIDTSYPTVTGITRLNAHPNSSASVNFAITFSEAVTGVDASDFNLTTSGVSGAAMSGFSGSGSAYTVIVNTGSGNGTIRLNVADNNSIADGAGNQLGGIAAGDGNFTIGEAYLIIKTPTFIDVPFPYWSWGYIERLYKAGITGGCTLTPLNYCPANSVTRAQMAIFLLRGIHGSAYTPPPATGTMFTDVSAGSFGAAWIERLAVEGITSGCGGGKFCPNSIVTRSQMAIFLVRAKHGVAFVPPAATGIFPDVPAGSFGANYIEQLVADGVTSGCGGGLYCPLSTVKRDSMAVFLVRNFNLP